MKSHSAATLVATLLLAAPAFAGSTPSQKCELAKNNEAAKLFVCRQKAHLKFVKNGSETQLEEKLAECTTKLGEKWPKIEVKAQVTGDPCPTVGGEADIASLTGVVTDDIAAGLGGGALPPSCAAGLLECQESNAEGEALLAALLEESAQTDAAILEAQADIAELEFDVAEGRALRDQLNAQITAAEDRIALLSAARATCRDDFETCVGDLNACLAP